ncbi:winged helix-turn-helix domain-containing protein [Biostraticola tofi]|uniref:DNA-binding winged helix-turn-helix (WHTH) protein n=1 Tax=Biostraticola tofi TaxID=466109 RepID=A0A4V2W4C0_9GAMM|nr:winged helix-turn-helix domain-containing protein [Biostraticola tofi]TCV95239.1 DNA-binding winged helix-turn-helix (wHTH) protein [Biostraticola tofi]
MKYLVNETVVFDTAEFTLCSEDSEPNCIKLSNSAGKVLEQLILHHGNGQVVTRDHFFEQVWTINGLQPSNGNLNQQVSLIRKALSNVGLGSSVIITVPKRGLKLSDKLRITALEAELSRPVDKVHLTDSFTGPSGSASGSLSLQQSTRLIPYIVMLLLAIFAAIIIYIYSYQNNNQPTYYFGKIDSCEVYTLRPVDDDERDDLTNDVRAVMKDNIDRCQPNSALLFSKTQAADKWVQDNINIRIFMAKCQKDRNGDLTRCLNYFLYNWTV